MIEAAPGLVDAIAVGKPTLEDVFIRLTGGRQLVADPAVPSPVALRGRRRAAG